MFRPSYDAVGVKAMIDVVQALELFEICADEMASEQTTGECNSGETGRQRRTLTARALAKTHLHVAHLARYPLRGVPWDTRTDQPTMTLGAMIVFRTADKFVRAGAPTTRTLDALYRAVQRYVEVLPDSLQDGADQTAIHALMADQDRSSRYGKSQRPSITGRCGGMARSTQAAATSHQSNAYAVTRLANP
jgi:hypothetical protein